MNKEAQDNVEILNTMKQKYIDEMPVFLSEYLVEREKFYQVVDKMRMSDKVVSFDFSDLIASKDSDVLDRHLDNFSESVINSIALMGNDSTFRLEGDVDGLRVIDKQFGRVSGDFMETVKSWRELIDIDDFILEDIKDESELEAFLFFPLHYDDFDAIKEIDLNDEKSVIQAIEDLEDVFLQMKEYRDMDRSYSEETLQEMNRRADLIEFAYSLVEKVNSENEEHWERYYEKVVEEEMDY